MVACGGWLSLDAAQVLCSFVCVLDAMAGGVQFGGCWLHPPQWRFEGYAPGRRLNRAPGVLISPGVLIPRGANPGVSFWAFMPPGVLILKNQL